MLSAVLVELLVGDASGLSGCLAEVLLMLLLLKCCVEADIVMEEVAARDDCCCWAKVIV